MYSSIIIYGYYVLLLCTITLCTDIMCYYVYIGVSITALLETGQVHLYIL
jgi:hypothetical protein